MKPHETTICEPQNLKKKKNDPLTQSVELRCRWAREWPEHILGGKEPMAVSAHNWAIKSIPVSAKTFGPFGTGYQLVCNVVGEKPSAF
ncbi:hypothetical protein BaRGS_00022386 [Batillaria attramentaria]|uniref:Uncharacterized protein n=1 Tax=Batillaria attramentaria TaxID=370345 RepID=A0ABD0KGG0_9CAEN